MKKQTDQNFIKKIIWFAFIAASFIYMYALSTLSKNFESPTNTQLLDLNNPLELSISLAGVFSLGMAYTLPKVNLHKATSDFVLFIFRLACCEAAVLFGFALAFLSQNTDKFYPLFGAGMLGLLLLYPKDAKPSHRSGEDIGLS